MRKNHTKNRPNAKKSVARNRRHGGIVLKALKMKVRKGDTVKVISGKDKGKSGTVERVMPKRNLIVVEGVAIAKRHMKSTGRGQSGRIVERPMPINASNVAVTSSSAKAKPVKAAKAKKEAA